MTDSPRINAADKLIAMRQRVSDVGGDPDTEQFCSDCEQVKPFSAFPRSKLSPNGYGLHCKECLEDHDVAS